MKKKEPVLTQEILNEIGVALEAYYGKRTPFVLIAVVDPHLSVGSNMETPVAVDIVKFAYEKVTQLQ
jgi:hypothetical protein